MTMPSAPLAAGLMVGFSVAAPIGPMGLLCIQRTLASGMRVGVSTGLGAATVNVVYAALILAGLGWLAPWLASFGHWLSFAGGVFLLWSAARIARRRAPGQAGPGAVLSPLAAYFSAVAFNAANPMGPMLIVALLSPMAGAAPLGVASDARLLAGMFAAAVTWWVCLSGGVALLRSRLSPPVIAMVNQASAALLTLYGALALARSAGM